MIIEFIMKGNVLQKCRLSLWMELELCISRLEESRGHQHAYLMVVLTFNKISNVVSFVLLDFKKLYFTRRYHWNI